MRSLLLLLNILVITNVQALDTITTYEEEETSRTTFSETRSVTNPIEPVVVTNVETEYTEGNEPLTGLQGIAEHEVEYFTTNDVFEQNETADNIEQGVTIEPYVIHNTEIFDEGETFYIEENLVDELEYALEEQQVDTFNQYQGETLYVQENNEMTEALLGDDALIQRDKREQKWI